MPANDPEFNALIKEEIKEVSRENNLPLVLSYWRENGTWYRLLLKPNAPWTEVERLCETETLNGPSWIFDEYGPNAETIRVAL